MQQFYAKVKAGGSVFVYGNPKQIIKDNLGGTIEGKKLTCTLSVS
jgi:hypothetical protein